MCPGYPLSQEQLSLPLQSTMPFQKLDTDELCINTIRTLAADVVNKANSGHPGAPMGMAPVAHVLFSRFFNVNPKNSLWFNRDRFVLSNGHACALQYILLHLLGFKLTLDDLKQFRQIGSLTPGHPERGHTDGVEVTTGPLGQGFTNAVGLAIAQAHLGAVYNKDGFDLINNHTYVFLGDGCLMEGVTSEAASLAGHLRLGNLIAIYDDNQISIDGDTAVAFTENVEQRFSAYGWHVLHVDDGNGDLEGIYAAIEQARQVKDRPTIIRLRTIIGFGSKQQGTHGIHGSPLKPDDTEQLKAKFGFDPKATFHVPQKTYDIYADIAKRGAKIEQEWDSLLSLYGKRYPEEHAVLTRRIKGDLPDGWEKALPIYKPGDAPTASRKLSELVLTAVTPVLPDLLGGSADLTTSNLTRVKNAEDFQHPTTKLGSYKGTYIRYGVREHAMGAIMNGIAAYGGIIPFAGTFLNFVSYAAGAVRLSALSRHHVIWVATHDSIGLGEDGPTHQPIETIAHFRALPQLVVWRPADGNETSAAYLVALKSKNTPSLLSLSRQNLPNLEGSTIERAARGGYVLREVENEDLTIVSTGSEVSIAVEAAGLLEKEGVKTRIVSLPSWEVFDSQDQDYRLSVLRSGAPILSFEALTTMGWAKYSHEQFGIDTFGASAPYQKVYAKHGFTGPNVAELGKKVAAFYKKRGGEVVSPLVSAI
ncbi:putative transketolase [Ramaria rubella]|nr:putative transketolase [Ramaria rubella]